MALDIDSIYEKLIGRKAGSEGKGYWTQQYNTATTGDNKQTSEDAIKNIENAIKQGKEYTGRETAKSTAQTLHGKEALTGDAQESWLDRIIGPGGDSIANIGDTMKADVDTLYRKSHEEGGLGRAGNFSGDATKDSTDANYWVHQMMTGGADMGEVQRNVKASGEYMGNAPVKKEEEVKEEDKVITDGGGSSGGGDSFNWDDFIGKFQGWYDNNIASTQWPNYGYGGHDPVGGVRINKSQQARGGRSYKGSRGTFNRQGLRISGLNTK
jgi:hypothetical protein